MNTHTRTGTCVAAALSCKLKSGLILQNHTPCTNTRTHALTLTRTLAQAHDQQLRPDASHDFGLH
jgi:hypothetical protein